MSFITNLEMLPTFNKPTETQQKSSNKAQQAEKKSALHKKKLISKAQKGQPKLEGINIGQWTQTQNFLYASFLQANIEQLQSQLKRRQTKIFVRMEKLICTRTADQCRSHHQKCMKKYGSAEEVVKSLLLSKTQSKKNSSKSIGFLNSSFTPVGYDFLSNNYSRLSFSLDELKNSYIAQKTCNCHLTTGAANTKQNTNDKMLAFLNQKSDQDKDLPKTGLQNQESINQDQIPKVVFCQTQNKFSIAASESKNLQMELQDQLEGTKKTNTKNLALKFGAKGNNSFESFILKKKEQEKIKITLQLEGIGNWSLNY